MLSAPVIMAAEQEAERRGRRAEDTPAATMSDSSDPEMFGPPPLTPGCWNGPPVVVIGSRPAGVRVADIGERVLAEHVPLHAELAAGLARRLDEAHFQHDLLRLQRPAPC